MRQDHGDRRTGRPAAASRGTPRDSVHGNWHSEPVDRLVYGRRPVIEALRAGVHPRRLLVADQAASAADGDELLELAQRFGVPVVPSPRERLDTLTNHGVHQGIVALLPPLRFAEPEELLARARDRREAPLLLGFDSVHDPQNVGTLLRTAEVAGAHGAIVPERRSAGLGSGVEKSSAGALAHLALCQVTNLVRTLGWFKEQGVWVVGLDAAATTRYDLIDLTRPVLIVVGSEGDGLRRLVRETCDDLVRIPMRGNVESLNVGVAGSLMLYEAWCARGFAGSRL